MTGITPQFAHVNAIRVHELSEHLMLQLGTVGSRAMVQFGTEVKIKVLGHPTTEYVDIANFDRYDMIISTPYMQDDSADEGRYERPQQMRSYASTVTQSVLPLRAEYVQYVHPVNEVLLQHLEWAGQPIPATAAFLQDDLAVMVVEGLLDQIELMRRQRVTTLEQIECIGKRKAPTFKELMVRPKQARAPSQRPQELVWAPAHTVAWLLP
ncbi:hypothetical protein C0995_007247 [Termitomyces sp. Mi166|nr:hypothetical protein C0995_007247 [Termitomyces sp. Mi166\